MEWLRLFIKKAFEEIDAENERVAAFIFNGGTTQVGSDPAMGVQVFWRSINCCLSAVQLEIYSALQEFPFSLELFYIFSP